MKIYLWLCFWNVEGWRAKGSIWILSIALPLPTPLGIFSQKLPVRLQRLWPSTCHSGSRCMWMHSRSHQKYCACHMTRAFYIDRFMSCLHIKYSYVFIQKKRMRQLQPFTADYVSLSEPQAENSWRPVCRPRLGDSVGKLLGVCWSRAKKPPYTPFLPIHFLQETQQFGYFGSACQNTDDKARAADWGAKQ